MAGKKPAIQDLCNRFVLPRDGSRIYLIRLPPDKSRDAQIFIFTTLAASGNYLKEGSSSGGSLLFMCREPQVDAVIFLLTFGRNSINILLPLRRK
jgi:hypothetical protein